MRENGGKILGSSPAAPLPYCCTAGDAWSDAQEGCKNSLHAHMLSRDKDEHYFDPSRLTLTFWNRGCDPIPFRDSSTIFLPSSPCICLRALHAPLLVCLSHTTGFWCDESDTLRKRTAEFEKKRNCPGRSGWCCIGRVRVLNRLFLQRAMLEAA